MNRALYLTGFFLMVGFWIFAFIWVGVIHYVLLEYIDPVIFDNGKFELPQMISLPYVLIGIFGGMGMIAIWYYSYAETKIIEGANRKIRKQKKKKLKLERQLKLLKLKKETEEQTIKTKSECSKLNCEIKQLENQKNNKYQVCSTCGKQASLEACFCPQCGSLLN